MWKGTRQSNYPFRLKSIVSNIEIDEWKRLLEVSETRLLKEIEIMEKNKEKQKIREYVEYFLPKMCRYVYDNNEFEIRIGTLKI